MSDQFNIVYGQYLYCVLYQIANYVDFKDMLSRNSGLNGGQPKSCFGKPRAKFNAVSKPNFLTSSSHMSTPYLQLRGGEPPLL